MADQNKQCSDIMSEHCWNVIQALITTILRCNKCFYSLYYSFNYYCAGSVYIGPFNDYLHYHHIIDINCTGSESNIQDCPSNNLTNYYCPSYRDAGVSCNGELFITM